jgi:hypothetical protein
MQADALMISLIPQASFRQRPRLDLSTLTGTEPSEVVARVFGLGSSTQEPLEEDAWHSVRGKL